MIAVFVCFGLAAVVSALLTVQAPRLVHGVVWLGVMLGSTAVLFVQLGAPFLAAIQLLLYVGGVMTLMIFGVMLTRADESGEPRSAARPRFRGALLAIVMLGVLGSAVSLTKLSETAGATPSTAQLGSSLLTDHLLAFEVLSALLLAAMIGAIVLARRRDPEGT